jgi:hypothetical protein
MSERTLQILALAFLALTITGGWMIGPYNKLEGRGKDVPLPMKLGPLLGDRPVIQIELARWESDLCAILNSGDWQKNADDARKGNELDTFLFIPGYAGLLLFFGLLVGRQVPQWRTAVSVIALVVAPFIAILDWLENAGITAALNHFQASRTFPVGDALRISTPSSVKWTLIAFLLLAYFVALLANAGKISWAYRLIASAALSLSAITFYTLVRYVIARVG